MDLEIIVHILIMTASQRRWQQTALTEKIAEHLDRRGFISQTSCRICGKEFVKELFKWMQPLENNLKIDIRRA
jgi:hypothetical protein